MRVNKKRLFYHNTCEFYFFTDGNKKAGANKTPALSIAHCGILLKQISHN